MDRDWDGLATGVAATLNLAAGSGVHGLGGWLSSLVSTGPLVAGLVASLIAGALSFASPCVIPLVPGYISYLAGIVGGQMDYDDPSGPRVRAGSRGRVVMAACGFVAGFSVVFVLATVTFFRAISLLHASTDVIQRVGGVVTIIMGLTFIGWMPLLGREKRIRPKRWSTWLGAPLLGAVFALGWTPCLGPTLASIVSVAAGTEGMTALKGALLIIAYCVGLGVPFVVIAAGSATAMRATGWLRAHSRAIQVVGGILLVLVGLCLVAGLWPLIVGFIRQLTVVGDYSLV